MVCEIFRARVGRVRVWKERVCGFRIFSSRRFFDDVVVILPLTGHRTATG